MTGECFRIDDNRRHRTLARSAARSGSLRDALDRIKDRRANACPRDWFLRDRQDRLDAALQVVRSHGVIGVVVVSRDREVIGLPVCKLVPEFAECIRLGVVEPEYPRVVAELYGLQDHGSHRWIEHVVLDLQDQVDDVIGRQAHGSIRGVPRHLIDVVTLEREAFRVLRLGDRNRRCISPIQDDLTVQIGTGDFRVLGRTR